MASAVANGFEETTEPPEPKKPVKRGFAKIDVIDVILSDDKFEKDTHKGSLFGQVTDSTLSKSQTYAPTYRTEPKKRFDADAVYKIVKEQLEKELGELSYGEKECQNACKRTSYYIRRAVKQLNYDRYRIVCQVRIVEKINQGFETRTGFLWDTTCDGFTSYEMETQSFTAQAVVFGVYKD